MRTVRDCAPQMQVIAVRRADGEPLCSRLGVAANFPTRSSKQVYPKLTVAAAEPSLHTYDRDDRSAMGVDTDPEITVHED